MKFLLAAALFTGLSVATVSAAHAQQSGPAFPTAGKATPEAAARRNTGNNAEELARNQRRAAMTPEEIKRDQQLELLEARTGNTSFGRNGSPERQFDSNSSGGGFMVRKFKAQPGKPGAAQHKRGMAHFAGGSDPKGKPLVHKHGHKKFLLF